MQVLNFRRKFILIRLDNICCFATDYFCATAIGTTHEGFSGVKDHLVFGCHMPVIGSINGIHIPVVCPKFRRLRFSVPHFLRSSAFHIHVFPLIRSPDQECIIPACFEYLLQVQIGIMTLAPAILNIFLHVSSFLIIGQLVIVSFLCPIGSKGSEPILIIKIQQECIVIVFILFLLIRALRIGRIHLRSGIFRIYIIMAKLPMVIDRIVPKDSFIFAFVIVIPAIRRFPHRLHFGGRCHVADFAPVLVVSRRIELICSDIQTISLLVIIARRHFHTVLRMGACNNVNYAAGCLRAIQNRTAATNYFNMIDGISTNILQIVLPILVHRHSIYQNQRSFIHTTNVDLARHRSHADTIWHLRAGKYTQCIA